MKHFHFLASYPKSGNTWCRAFLSNYLAGGEKPIGVNELTGGGMASARGFVDELLGMESSILTECEIALMRKAGLCLSNARLSEKTFMKVHDSFPHAGEPDWFPTDAVAGVVYIVRNPLDVAVSLANHLGVSMDEAVAHVNDDGYAFSDDPGQWNLQFRQRLHSWSGHVLSWLDGYKGDLCLVRYEDLYADPVGTFGKIVRDVGLEFDETKLGTAIRNSDFSVLKKDEEAHGFFERSSRTKTFFNKGRCGSWRRDLSERNVRDIVECHGHVMRRLGYLGADGRILPE
jgi:hypothetical protein